MDARSLPGFVADPAGQARAGAGSGGLRLMVFPPTFASSGICTEANPDVLVLHKPAMPYDEPPSDAKPSELYAASVLQKHLSLADSGASTLHPEDRTSHMVLEVIKSHVTNRGLGFASDPKRRQVETSLLVFARFTLQDTADLHFYERGPLTLACRVSLGYGCGSTPMVPFWCRCTTHGSLFGGDWDVHRQLRDFDPWPYKAMPEQDSSTSKVPPRWLQLFALPAGSKRYGLQLADRIYLIGPTGDIREAEAIPWKPWKRNEQKKPPQGFPRQVPADEVTEGMLT